MNKKTIVVSALLGVLAGQSVMAMEQEKKVATWYETLTSGKALTTAAVVGGGAYVAVNHSDKVASAAKHGATLAKVYGNAGIEYAKAEPKKVATYAAAGALLSYGAYKLYNRKTTAESKVAGPSALNVDDILSSDEGSKYQQDALAKHPVWFSQLFVVLKDVYGSDQASRKSFLNKAIASGPADGNPHVLLEDTKLLGKMSKDMKVQLLQVCCIFTTEYMVDSINELTGMLANDQAFIGDMLQESINSGNIEAIIATFNELASPDFGLTEKQKTLVETTKKCVSTCLQEQAAFANKYSISA